MRTYNEELSSLGKSGECPEEVILREPQSEGLCELPGPGAEQAPCKRYCFLLKVWSSFLLQVLFIPPLKHIQFTNYSLTCSLICSSQDHHEVGRQVVCPNARKVEDREMEGEL